MSVNEVKSAKRVLDILSFFAREKEPASLARIAGALDFPKSSCLALLDTLMAEGYAYQSDGRYYLTSRWAREAEIVARHDRLPARCRPTLEKLNRSLEETVILAQLAGRKVVYLDVIEADRVLRFSAHIGQRKPIHAGASGRALLAALPDEELHRAVRGLDYEVLTASTPRTPEALLRIVAEGRRRGWHVNLGDHQADTVSVAATATVDGNVVALVAGAPMSRIKKVIDRVGTSLMNAAAELTAANPNPGGDHAGSLLRTVRSRSDLRA